MSPSTAMTVKTCKEADHLYVLMTDRYRISRNMRAQWYFARLNTYVSLAANTSLDNFNNEIDLVSVLPSNYQDYHDLGSDSQYSGQYFISTNSKVTFFSRRYRLAYVLDLSPSVSLVDIQKNKVLLDEMFTTVAKSLRGLVQPFYVPGSQFLFAPEIFVTVIAYIPFYSCDNQQVLAQGWKITAQNIDSFLSEHFYPNLSEIISSVSEISAKAKDERDDDQSESDVMLAHLFDENANKKSKSSETLLATPDISTVNILKIGLLALQLLPENSSAGIVVVTDGMLSFPNANDLESALTYLRQHTISCSFLQVGSSAHPFSCFGFVPYTELMKFISTATFGAYLSDCPDGVSKNQDSHDYNLYHRAFLAWNFQRGLFGFRADINHKPSRNPSSEWHVDNAYFYSTHDYGLNSNRETRDQQIVRNKLLENTVSADLTQVLSCRLREGYTIKSVNYSSNENQLEVRLLLPWRHNVNIEYNLSSMLSPDTIGTTEESGPQCHYEVIAEGSYNFLHDVTCSSKRPIKSAYRSATIKLFRTTLTSLSDSDQHEVHLHNFTHNAWSRNIPESIKNGVPLFYMPPNSSEPVVSSKNAIHTQFAQQWKWMLDVEYIQKWMHTHTINVVLEHDLPLTKHLHLPNNSGRFQTVQCRQAMSSLNVVLSDSSSFILLENHSYIKLLESNDSQSPHSFYLIRVKSQPPSVVIDLNFVGGTPGQLRNEIVTELKERLKNCKLPKRSVSISYHKQKNSQTNLLNETNDKNKSERKTPSPSQKQWVDTNCCVVLSKPIDKILIRYDRMPKDFTAVMDKSLFCQNQTLISPNRNHISAQPLPSLNIFQTLSRYLYHQRWIWTTNYGPNMWLSSASLAKILTILMKMRLKEGFNFAHNDSGISNMIQELPLKDQNENTFSCVVQYVIFPPHVISTSRDRIHFESLSDDEELELTEDDGELQLITECWVEPQHGLSYDCRGRKEFLDGLNYKEISQSFHTTDLEAISCLLTFEHSLIMCQNNELDYHTDDISFPSTANQTSLSPDNQLRHSSSTYMGGSSPDIASVASSLVSERIQMIRYRFDIIALLSKAQQAVVLFSTLFQTLNVSQSSDEPSNDATNELLFDLLFAKISSIHDKEIKLSQSECIAFVNQVNQRNESNNQFVQCSATEMVGRFRCFIKKLSQNSILVTVIPATFNDLKLIVFDNNTEDSIDSLNILHEIDDNSSSSDTSLFGCLSLPIFIYKTSFNSLGNQLIEPTEGKLWPNKGKDIYLDNTYKSQKSDSTNYPFELFRANEKENESLSKGSIWLFCRSLQLIYWNCMTKALYRALQFGNQIDKRDILKIVENITDKFVLTLDLSKFLIYLCEHLKEYLLKWHNNDTDFDVNQLIEAVLQSDATDEAKTFTLDSLVASLRSCSDMKDLHSDIKDKFQASLRHYMSPMPSFPSFYFFNCKSVSLSPNDRSLDNSVSDSNLADKSLVNSVNEELPRNSAINTINTLISETKAETIRSDDSYSHSTLKSFPKVENQLNDENLSLSKSNSSKLSCTALDLTGEDLSSTPNLCTTSKTETLNSDTYLESASQPLFLRLSCSIQTQYGVKECYPHSLPTCLRDIIDSLDGQPSETLLQELKISLNIICMIQSDDSNVQTVLPLLQKRDSVVSNDLLSHTESVEQTVNQECTEEKLSQYQLQSLKSCVDKISWLLNDEIVSIALDSYPICESSLQMVISHIDQSPETDFCFKRHVGLKFVFGDENNANYDVSLHRFCESMARIKLPGFQLIKLGKYYYIADEKEANDQHKQTKDAENYLSSLIPSLSSNLSLHFNDAINDSKRETIGTNEEPNRETSSQNSFNLLKLNERTKTNDNSDDSLDESQTSDTHKKQMSRKYLKSRSASVPPTASSDVPHDKSSAGHSLPEADLESIKKFKLKSKSKSHKQNGSRKQLISVSIDETNVKNTDTYSEGETFQSCDGNGGQNYEEEGYEGDSDDDSDAGNDNWMALDSKQPLAPKFWLIMNVTNDSVVIYFHTRPKDISCQSYTKGIEMFNLVIELVENICKTVNQMLLLKDLHDTRMCDDLLVPVEDNDPWNKASRRGLHRTQVTHESDNDTDVELNVGKNESKLTKTNLSFTHGSFACRVVWDKHFPLHPRLQSGGPSRGISAMRTFLNSFSVNNRQNLFVYQESLNSVFYLRLYEVNCSKHNYNKEIRSLNCSKSPSESSLFVQNKRINSEELSEGRNRVDSNLSDKDDSLSLTSVTSSHVMRANSDRMPQTQCILLNVHGIRDVGKDIKEEMVTVLQKKLDEAVLEILIIMLSRNPLSKLTSEDVSFIQKCYTEPTETFRFITDPQYLQSIHSLKVYLRQNLLTFMHNPKYTESNPEFHFKIQNPNHMIETNDFDTFLYYRQQSFGSDSKGIACIVLSLVDGRGDAVPHQSCPPLQSVGQTDLKALLSGSFDEVTKCERYAGVSAFDNLALIQFQIWSVGKIDLAELSRKLQLAIKHAIWDLTLEFKILRTSLNKEFGLTEVMYNSFSVSEPSTPKNVANLVRGRKSGRMTIETSHLSRLEPLMSSSTSVPNIIKSVRKTEDIFEFPEVTHKSYDSPKQSILRMHSETAYKEESAETRDELSSLSYVLNLLVRPWLDFGKSLEVVSVFKQQYFIAMRHSIPYVIKEFKNYIQNSSPHMTLNVFKKNSDFMYSPCNDFDMFETDCQFESIMDLIVLVRHEKLWKTGDQLESDSTLETFLQSKGERPKLRFYPHICNIKPKTLIEPKPVLAVSNSSLNSSIAETKSQTGECVTCVAPRQKFLLLYVEDKQITLYLYNWSNEFLTNICKNLSNIISWHNSRGAFLQSIITQKAGIFQNQALKRKTSNNLNISSFGTGLQTVSNSSNLTQYFKNQKQRFNSFAASMNDNLDLLIKHHNPVSAAQEYSQIKKLSPQSMAGSYNLFKCLRDQWHLTPLQSTSLSKIRDLVHRFGKQIKLCQNNQSKELQELSKIWHIWRTHETPLHSNPVFHKVIKQFKHFARLNHYCLTPLLFSPKWRLTVSPVRDHSLQSTDNFEDNARDIMSEKQRLRHASSGYVKKSDETDATFNRSRRQSGPAVSGSVPKTNVDESWHLTVCSDYIKEYMEYLQTFRAIQVRPHRLMASAAKPKQNSDNSLSNFKLNNKLSIRKLSPKGEHERYFFYKASPGGLLVFEVGFSEPYVFSHLYSFDARRLEMWNRNRKSSDNTMSFLDEMDQIKLEMHLHSFTYDYHLRTIHSYISGRPIIRQGYHLTSFLDDFIKYYQKAPNYARNYVYSGQISVDKIKVPSKKLYDYISAHNDLYGMKVFRMNYPVSGEEDFDLANEYVLVELSSHRVPYRDLSSDTRQIDNFNVGVIITHDLANPLTEDTTLTLKFFVLLTSQRLLFPKQLSSHCDLHSKGHFKPIRLYASQPSSGTHSRKSSTMTDPNLSDESYSDASVKSTKELTSSTSSALFPTPLDKVIAKSVPLLSTSAGICDEEITYLGYFSSHETMMLQILHDKATDTQLQLTNAVKRAAVDCRRETLWSSLLQPKSVTDADEPQPTKPMTCAEFDELLALVEMIKLDEYDGRLRPFTGLHISWYQSLAKTLLFKSSLTNRTFQSADTRTLKYVFTQNSCLDSFVLLKTDLNLGLGELYLVFKRLMSNGNRNSYLDSSGLQCHSLVEELVNGCAYYMWSAIP